MNLNEMLEILACPACKSQLTQDNKSLHCQKCKKFYLVIDGVPYFLDKGAYQFDPSLSRTFEFRSKVMNSRIVKGLKYFFGADFVPGNPLKKYYNLFQDQGKNSRRILNIGSGSTKIEGNVINLDIENFPNVNLVADGCQMPFAENSFDFVISEAVIEHVRYPQQFIKEIKRVLKRSGLVFIVAPFIHPFHGYPSDFQRFSVEGLKVCFEDFKEIECGVYRGPSVALVNFLSDYLASLFFLENQSFRLLFKQLFTLLLFPVKFLDFFLIKSKNSFKLAHCVYYIGEKVL